MLLHDVIGVKPVAEYLLRVEFDDGTVGDVDIARLIEFSGVFAPLLDMDFFRQVYVHPEFGVLCWPNGADLDSDVLYSLVMGVRIGWAEQSAAMAANGDDALIDGEALPTEFEEREWQWQAHSRSYAQCHGPNNPLAVMLQ